MLDHRFFQSLLRRKALVRGAAAGFAGLAAVWLIPSELSSSSRAIIAWDVGLITFFVSIWAIMRRQTAETMRQWALKLDAGRRTVLLLTLLAAAAALQTVFVEMKLAKVDHGLLQAVRIALVIGTVAMSWFFVQTIFALEYSHEYFTPDEVGADRCGLSFPGGEIPDFWDFLHFSVVIGATAQTADISLVSKTMRRMVTVQSLIAFTYNAVILALTINLTAGLLG